MNTDKLKEFYNAMQALFVDNIPFKDIYFASLTKADYENIFLGKTFNYKTMRTIFDLSHVEFEYVFSEKWAMKIGDTPERVLERLSTLIDEGVPQFWDVTTCEVRVKDSPKINL